MTDYIKIAELHFEDLRATLESKSDKKAYVLIIEYLLNFLGCLSLATLNRNNLTNLSRNENISDLTAGQWANCIMRTLDLLDNQRESEQIKAIFLASDGRLPPSIESWLDLRNKLTHDIILIDDKQLERLLEGKRFLHLCNFNFFTERLKRLIKDFPYLLKSKFFKIDNNTSLFIYAGVEDDYRIKYKHFKYAPLTIPVEDFPLTYKKVFVSLEQTPQNILVGEDKITAQIRTMRSRTDLTFQLWINGIKAQERQENVSDWSSVAFVTNDLDIKDSEINTIEIKVLNRNRELDFKTKNIFFYKILPKPVIKLEGIEEKKIPVDKAIDLTLRIGFKFEIKDLQIKAFCPDDTLEIFSQPKCKSGNDFSASCILQVMATTIGEHTIMVEATYSDKKEISHTIAENFKVIATPNFYNPSFVGDKRQQYIAAIQQNKKHYLITGEGGIGKSRLIQEALSNSEYKEITISASSQLADKIAESISYRFEKKKADEKLFELLQVIEQMKGMGREYIFWLKDSHEINKEEPRDFLKTLLEKTSNTNIRFIIESRDRSWSQNAERLIMKLEETGIEHVSLERLSNEDLRKIIDSVLMPNKFEGYIGDIIKQSNGIVYILLTILKKLYEKNCFTPRNDIWEIREDSGIEQELLSLKFDKVIKTDVEDTLKILDANGLGIQARELLKYLCIKEIPVSMLESLLSISSSYVHCLLEILESNCIIKRHDKLPHENKLVARLKSLSKEEINELFGKTTEPRGDDEDAIAKETTTKRSKEFKAISFHHQLKQNYYKGKYLSEEMLSDYIIQLAIKWDNNIEDFDYEFFDPGWLKEEFRNLSKFNLSEKLDFLVFNEAAVPEAIIGVFFEYGDDISKEQAISYAERTLWFMNEQIDRLMSKGFDEIKHQIEEFLKQKGIAENEWLELKTEFEYNSLMYYLDYLLQKEQEAVIEKTWNLFGGDVRYEEYQPKQDITIFAIAVQLTGLFLKNRGVLEEIYDRLDTLRIRLAVLEYKGDDVNFSWAHLTGILLYINSEEAMNRKEEYMQVMHDILSNPPMKKPAELLNFISFHKRILKDNPKLTELINNVEKKLWSLLSDF